MVELFIENSKLDTSEFFSTMLTMAIDDVKDFDAKHTTFSKTIILPATKNNNLTLGNIFEITGANSYDPTLPNKGANFNAAIGAKAIMFQDNIQIFKGTFRLLEIIIDDGFIEYECSVVGELGGFVAKVAALKLEDLDFSAYDHTYDLATIVSSWANTTSGDGIYYPLIDYGNYSTNKKDFKYKTLRPALFVKEYIDKIFANAGYSYDCNLFTGTTADALRFKSLIIPNNKKTLTRKALIALDLLDNHVTIFSAGGAIVYVPFSLQPILGDFVPNGTNEQFTFTSAATVTGIFTLHIKGSYTKTSTVALTFDVYRNGSSIATVSLGAGLTGLHAFDFTIDSASTTVNNGDIISVQLAGSTLSGNTFSANMTEYELKITTKDKQTVTINLGEQVYMNDVLPQNILQRDFVSSIVKLFNLYIFEDRDKDKHLKIMPFVDFYAGASSIDWTLKIDRSQPLRIKPMSELNARYYDFKFRADSDYYNDLYAKRYNETYGSYKYDSQYEFSKDSHNIELIFSGTPLVGYNGCDKLFSSIFKLTNGVEDNVDSNIRLLQAKKITSVTSWDILADNGTTILGSYTDYPYAGHLDDPDAPANDINFGVPKELFFTLVIGALNINQFNVYWSSYMAEITDKDSKLLTAKVKLNYKDIYTLDFSKLIYIDGSLFRLNKIIDYNATNEDTCTAEFIKVINKIY
jgi:hypothetical protein